MWSVSRQEYNHSHQLFKPFKGWAPSFPLQWKQRGWTHMFLMGKIHLTPWSSIHQGALRHTPMIHPTLDCASTASAVGTRWATSALCWRIQTGHVCCLITVLRRPHHLVIQLRHRMWAMQSSPIHTSTTSVWRPGCVQTTKQRFTEQH